MPEEINRQKELLILQVKQIGNDSQPEKLLDKVIEASHSISVNSLHANLLPEILEQS